MFEHAINLDYTKQDATLEILIMLLGAFLLGLLLGWLLKSSRSKKHSYSKQKHHASAQQTDNNASSVHHNQALASTVAAATSNDVIASNTARKAVRSKRRTELKDDLTRISGIDSDIQYRLYDNKIKTYQALRDIDENKLKNFISSASLSDEKTIEAESWPHQAGLAADDEWEKLRDYQNFMDRAQKNTRPQQNTSDAVHDTTTGKQKDDFKKIEGIGPKIEALLNQSGIHTFQNLAEQDHQFIKKLLEEAGPQFKMHEPKSWPEQARLAAKGEWKKLEQYQDFLISGRQ